MNIALIAHDSKKELMVQFCIAYCRVLSQHDLCATGTTGKLVAEATGLRIQRFLSGTHGGDQQIAARIACNEIDLLLFFRDPISAKPHEPNEMNLLRLCDVHNIPIATNIATAEVLIHGLERGDLDWRNIVNPDRLCYGIFNLPVMYSRAAEAAAHAGIRAPAEMKRRAGGSHFCKIHRSVRQKHNACKRCGNSLERLF